MNIYAEIISGVSKEASCKAVVRENPSPRAISAAASKIGKFMLMRLSEIFPKYERPITIIPYWKEGSTRIFLRIGYGNHPIVIIEVYLICFRPIDSPPESQ